MTFIPTVAENEAEGALASLYRRFGNPDGTVDEVLKAHSLNPESLEAHCALYVQSIHRPSPLSRAEREMIGVTVSRINGCVYCLQHHAAGLRRLLGEEREDVADSLRDGSSPRLTAREAALVQFADRLTRDPATITEADVEHLRTNGMSDREILDAVQVAAYFAYANRIVLGLGVELENDAEAIGQWPAV